MVNLWEFNKGRYKVKIIILDYLKKRRIIGMNDVEEQFTLLKARTEEMEQKIAQLEEALQNAQSKNNEIQAELNCMKERHKHLGWSR